MLRDNSWLRFISAWTVLLLAWSTVLPAQQAIAATPDPDNSAGAYTLSDLKNEFPEALFIEVSPEELELARAGYGRVGRPGNARRAVPSRSLSGDSKSGTAVIQNSTPIIEKAGSVKQKPTDKKKSGMGGGSFNPGGGGGKGVAVILFAVIGIVVVGFLVLSAGTVLYDTVVNERVFPKWLNIDAQITGFDSEQQAEQGKGFSESGWMAGIIFSFGLDNPETVGVGFLAEVGHFHGRLEVVERDSRLNLSGTYYLIGPTIRFDSKNKKNTFL